MKQHIKEKYKIELEMIPPGCHRCNAAEVAIRNFKSHFLSVLAGTAESFPLHLWDRLLPQTELTLNLLQQSNATPTVSAYTHLSGPFDYNKMPLAPMGCEVQIHKTTDNFGTWSYHLVDGWYLATPPEHYHVHNCYVKTTQAERLTNTIQFKHKNITNPSISPHDKIMQALAKCKMALKGMMNDSANQQMEELRRIVNNAQAHLHQRQTTSMQPVLRVELQQVLRVDTNDPHQAPPRTTETHTPSRMTKAQQCSCHNSLSHLTAKINLPAAPPALSTHSKECVADERQRVPRLRQPTQSSLGKTRHTNAIITTPNWQHLRRKVEQDVERALAVMDQDSGKMMNYHQLMKHPKFNKAWKKSSANKFGRLASGVGGRVKGTRTI
jgi:hypothetical protein